MKKLASISWVMLLASVSITLLIWIGYSYNLTQSQNQSFTDDANLMTILISDELQQYEQVLVGAKGLFAASENVEFDEWRTFIAMNDLSTRYPGLQGVGYAQHTMHDDREKLVSQLKNYGIDNFEIIPSGDRDEYYPILFLEPSDVRNQKAIGYDIYFEQTRRDAVNLVKETGTTAITGKIILVQEIEDNIQNGFLMLVPIYSNTDSDSLQGLVYTVFRIDDFVQGTVDLTTFEDLRLKIYDDQVSDENLFFNSDDISQHTLDDIDFSTTIPIPIHNRNWVFVYEGVENPPEQIGMLLLFFIPMVGFSMSLLLFYVFRVLAKNLRLTQDAANSEKITTIGTMASRMSHDLKNPLTVIKSNLELLRMNLGPNIDEKTKHYANRIENSIDSVFSIIDDVLEFAKSSKMHKEKISINSLLKIVLSNIEIPKDIQINLPKNEMSLNCDSSKMKSVFSNLITNSIQSIEHEGIITISTEADPENVVISIVDSGPGIPSDKISQIFDPLFTTKSTGTGLGLGICKNIVEQHGGKISVHNNPTTFTIKLPKNDIVKKPVDENTETNSVLRRMINDIKKIMP
ncbi:MAG: CHASE domain-containing protein [Nitrosopumilus sp.]|nr:CHASE domain-containing protein [Nitrosopumilus sp.]